MLTGRAGLRGKGTWPLIRAALPGCRQRFGEGEGGGLSIPFGRVRAGKRYTAIRQVRSHDSPESRHHGHVV